ncbi:adhesion G-protein coupled receptor G5 [Tiliqua scincoides]|uniref:adhesion G-protein coupled receptor G5 n=1 Tax=Tiliqua scincoides TaxID=71010 RepID=UPI00346183A4
MVRCQCNHLTYFAILLQNSPTVMEEALLAPLTYLTIIGCSLSASASLITIVLYIFSRKKLHDSTTKIHMNLLGALLFLNISFLASEPQASVNSPGLCSAAAIFLHYSLLCSLTWMAIEGFHLYMLIIRVYRLYISRYLLKLCSVGWGLPGVAVMITLLIKREVYGMLVVPGSSAYRNSTMCWITSCYHIVHTLNLVYFGGIILFNMTVLIMVVQRLRKLRANPQEQERTSCKDTVTVLGLTCLLGAAWAPALISFGVLTISQIFLFTILNSLQGVFICVWYCALRCHSQEVPQDGASPVDLNDSCIA